MLFSSKIAHKFFRQINIKKILLTFLLAIFPSNQFSECFVSLKFANNFREYMCYQLLMNKFISRVFFLNSVISTIMYNWHFDANRYLFCLLVAISRKITISSKNDRFHYRLIQVVLGRSRSFQVVLRSTQKIDLRSGRQKSTRPT